MKTPKQSKPQFEVDDPKAAFQKLESAMKHIMEVPKATVDTMIEKERSSRKKRK